MPLFDENGNEVSVDEVIKSQGIRDQLKEAEKTKTENESLKLQLAQNQRDSALSDLGVPKDGHGALVRKLLDGDPSKEKVDAIVAEYGLSLGQTPTPAPIPAPTGTPSPTELDQLRQLQGAVGSSAGQTIDPIADAYKRMSQAKSQDEIMEIVREVADKQLISGVVYEGQIE